MNAPSIPVGPAEGSSVWYGADLSKRPHEWTYRLSGRETDEVESAIAATKRRGLEIKDITREDFPLPTVCRIFDDIRRELLHGRGFVLLRGLSLRDRPLV